VRHASALNPIWLSFSTTRQRQIPLCDAVLPTQYMRTKQTWQAIIDCRYWLPAGGCTTEEFISLVHGSPIGRLWSHLLLRITVQSRKVMTQQDLPILFVTQ
jgi:hypothetical protein